MYALSTGYFPQLHHDYDPRSTRPSDVPTVLPDGDVYIDVFLKGGSMKSYKDFFIDYVSEYGYGPLDDDYLEYVAQACDGVEHGTTDGESTVVVTSAIPAQ